MATGLRLVLLHRRFVQLHVAPGQAVERESGRSLQAAVDHGDDVGTAFESMPQGLGQRSRITGWGEQRVLVGPGHVAVTGQIRRHHWCRRRHPLQQHHSEALPVEGRGAERRHP